MTSLPCKLFISLCLLHLLTATWGRPMSKRTVSEVQLMHNLREHQQVQERRDWLQSRLHGIHVAAARRGGPARRRRLFPGDVPDMSELTTEEIRDALHHLERLLTTQSPR